MQINALIPRTKAKITRRIGRGGKRGKTSGKGHKGQKARAGHKIRPAARDIIKRLPKRRGYGKNRSSTVNSGRVRPEGVNLKVLETYFENGDTVTPKALVAKGIIRRQASRVPAVKILGTGTLSKKLTLSNCTYSASAKQAIKTAGGTIIE